MSILQNLIIDYNENEQNINVMNIFGNMNFAFMKDDRISMKLRLLKTLSCFSDNPFVTF